MMSSRELPTTMYRSWVWCAECSSLDVCGTLWTNLLPRTKNKATIEVFAGQPNEESDWETTTYCPSTRLVSRSSFEKGKLQLPFFSLGRFRFSAWRDSKAVMQRIANPSSPVRLRVAPPPSRSTRFDPDHQAPPTHVAGACFVWVIVDVQPDARMVKLVDTSDLKSAASLIGAYGFDPRSGYHIYKGAFDASLQRSI